MPNDHEENEEIVSSSVTNPVTPPPQPLNEGHEADVSELVGNLSEDVIASENSSSLSYKVILPSPTLTDAVVGELVLNASENSSSISVMVSPPPPTLTDAVVANLSDDVTSLDVSSSVSCPVTPPSQPLTEAIVVSNLDNGGDDDSILDVTDDYRGGGGSSRRSTVFLDGGVSGNTVGIKIGEYINRHMGDEDQCDDADDDDEDNDDYYDDDLDDMIPRSVSNRMRKIGKRAFTKRGRVYGKYGLNI